jgi:hypothetical protein
VGNEGNARGTAGTRRWCHASCCCGETELGEAFGPHDAQLWLDEYGYPSGYFGDEQAGLLAMIVAQVGRLDAEVRRLRVLEGAVREVMEEEAAWVAPKGPRGSGRGVGRPGRGPKGRG